MELTMGGNELRLLMERDGIENEMEMAEQLARHLADPLGMEIGAMESLEPETLHYGDKTVVTCGWKAEIRFVLQEAEEE